jgi:hypothetical protein
MARERAGACVRAHPSDLGRNVHDVKSVLVELREKKLKDHLHITGRDVDVVVRSVEGLLHEPVAAQQQQTG